jgi:hypothetical protein
LSQSNKKKDNRTKYSLIASGVGLSNSRNSFRSQSGSKIEHSSAFEKSNVSLKSAILNKKSAVGFSKLSILSREHSQFQKFRREGSLGRLPQNLVPPPQKRFIKVELVKQSDNSY